MGPTEDSNENSVKARCADYSKGNKAGMIRMNIHEAPRRVSIHLHGCGYYSKDISRHASEKGGYSHKTIA